MTVRFVDISAIPLPSYISYFPLGTTSCFHTFCQVTAKIGYPVTGYGNESRNRAARQRIPNKVWTDEDGVEHVEVAYILASVVLSLLSMLIYLPLKFSVDTCSLTFYYIYMAWANGFI